MFDRLKEFLIKYKRLILIVAGVLLIAVIAFFVIPRGEKKPSVSAPEASVLGNELVQNAPATPAELTPEQKSESNLLASAKSFVEIYGTYSNQSNYTNMEIVLPLASSRYRQELSLSLSNLRGSYKPGVIYDGTTTIVISKTTEAFDDTSGTATVLLQTQRKISSGTQSNYTIKYQNIRVNLVKEGDGWLVDDAKWL